MNTSRRRFGRTVASFATASVANSLMAQSDAAGGEGQEFFLRLLKSNNESIGRVLSESRPQESRGAGEGGRGGGVAALAAAYCAPESAYFRSEALIPHMEAAARALVAAQNPDGTLDASGNLSSPPDTGFAIESPSSSLAALRGIEDARLARTKELLGQFLRSAGEALATGGIHTPNHRWVVCQALARIHSLFPADRYVARIDDWLGEGIDIDADGQFCERSAGIYSRVTVNALITMARLLHRPALLDPVRRHLDMSLYFLHPDGEVETVASRRQDQSSSGSAANYLPYRYMAILDNNQVYAAVARMLTARPNAGGGSLLTFMEEPLLRKSLPAGGSIPLDYAKVFPNSSLARIRRGNISASVYGGSDWPSAWLRGWRAIPLSFPSARAGQSSTRSGWEGNSSVKRSFAAKGSVRTGMSTPCTSAWTHRITNRFRRNIAIPRETTPSLPHGTPDSGANSTFRIAR